MDRRSLPLVLAFGSILQGCPWIGGCGSFERTEVVSLSQEDLDDLVVQGRLQARRAVAVDTDTDTDADTDTAADTDTDTDAAADTDTDSAVDTDTDALDTDGVQPPLVDPTGLSCQEICAAWFDWTEVLDCRGATPDAGDLLAVECTVDDYCIGGRLHEVVTTPTRAIGPDATARRLAQMAHDEWASVAAFEALATELRTHGAPADLIRRVLAAAADEVRHARDVAALAHARGGVVPRLQTQAPTARTLEAIAKENVEEAIVVETWSALRAHVQARMATDPAIRAVMQGIADDETRHAELARDLDRWLRSRLDAAANARLDAVKADAIEALRQQLATQALPDETGFVLGEPSPEQAAVLLEGLAASVWRA